MLVELHPLDRPATVKSQNEQWGLQLKWSLLCTHSTPATFFLLGVVPLGSVSAGQYWGLTPEGGCWGFFKSPQRSEEPIEPPGQPLQQAPPGLTLQQAPPGFCFLWFPGLVSAKALGFMVELSISNHLGFWILSLLDPTHHTAHLVQSFQAQRGHLQWQRTCYIAHNPFNQELLPPSKV